MSTRATRHRAQQRAQAFERREIDAQELRAILERARGVLSSADHEKLTAAIDTLTFLTQLVEAEDVSGKQLRALLFGPEPAAQETTPAAGRDTASGAVQGAAVGGWRRARGRSPR
jgi:hypothetical protein